MEPPETLKSDPTSDWMINLSHGSTAILKGTGEGFWRFAEKSDGVMEVTWERPNPKSSER